MKGKFVTLAKSPAIWLGVLVLGAIVLVIAQNRDVFISPDENTTSAFIARYAGTGQLTMPYQFEDKLGSVLPRGTFLSGGQIIPILPVGFNIIGGTFDAVATGASFLIMPLCLLLLAVIQYYFVKNIFGSRTIAQVSTCFLLLMPPFFHFSTRSRVTDVIMTLFLALGVYLALRFYQRGGRKIELVLSGFFLSAAIFVNQKVIFLVFAFAVGMAATVIRAWYKDRPDFWYRLRTIPYYLIGLLIPGPALMMSNSMLYGSPLKNGYIAIANVAQTTGSSDRPVLNINPVQMWFNIDNYMLGKTFPLVALFMIIGLIGLKRSRQMGDTNTRLGYVVFLVVATIITCGYFSNIAAWGGSGDATLTASFLRYLLPIIFFALPLAAMIFLKLASTQRMVVGAAILFFAVWTNLYYPGGYYSIAGYTKRMQQFRSDIVATTPPESVIVTNSYDKVLYPYRRTMNLQAYPVVEAEGQFYPNAQTLASNLAYMTGRRPEKFFYVDESSVLTTNLTAALADKQLRLVAVGATSLKLYEVTK